MIDSVFTLELSKVAIENIRSFCDQRIPEGLRIEYKEDFPKELDLEKTICAFANTSGGIILIGVKAETNTNKPVEISGIELKKGLEEKIVDLCLSHIAPPVAFEVKVCDYKSHQNKDRNDRAVLFIRVEPSYAAPHYVLDTNEIMIRIHNKNDRADLRTIEALINRRKEVAESHGVTTAYFGSRRITVEGETYESIIFAPHYPTKSLTFYNKEENNWLFTIMNRVLTFSEQKPEYGRLTFISLSAEGKITRWCEIEENGYIVFQRLAYTKDRELDFLPLLKLLRKALKVIKEVYSHFGLYGNLSVGFTICNTTGYFLGPRSLFLEDYQCTHSQISVSETFTYNELSKLDGIVQCFLEKFCLYFGLVLEEKVKSEIIRGLSDDD